MAWVHHFICSLVVALAALHGTGAVTYDVVNTVPRTPGGMLFDREIGIPYTKQVMGTITNFIWSILQQPTAADRRAVTHVKVVISQYNTGADAFTDHSGGLNNEVINFTSLFIQNSGGYAKRAFTAVLYHEMTHVFQWSGNFRAPGGLTEGVADWVMFKAGKTDPGYGPPGIGQRWDEGYAVTALFLNYCEGLRKGFVATLNKKMRYAYSDHYFVELLGKPVDQLWREYKAKYGRH